jgi:hypothetical protein
MTDETKTKPTHVAYQVRPASSEGAKPHFNRIGSAFAHRDGEGFSVVLDAIPVDGRVVLRTFKERVAEVKAQSKPAKAAEIDW